MKIYCSSRGRHASFKYDVDDGDVDDDDNFINSNHNNMMVIRF